jgi:hypothetical protein
VAYPKSQSCSAQQQFERLNRARDFFGDCVKRGNDWLTLMRIPKIEALSEGRMAIINHFRVSTERNGLVNPTQAATENVAI